MRTLMRGTLTKPAAQPTSAPPGNLASHISSTNIAIARTGLADPDQMVRIGALDMLENVPAVQIWPFVSLLLADPVRGVRIRAASLLASVPIASQPSPTAHLSIRRKRNLLPRSGPMPSGRRPAPRSGTSSRSADRRRRLRPSTRLRNRFHAKKVLRKSPPEFIRRELFGQYRKLQKRVTKYQRKSHDLEALATLVQRLVDESMNWQAHAGRSMTISITLGRTPLMPVEAKSLRSQALYLIIECVHFLSASRVLGFLRFGGA